MGHTRAVDRASLLERRREILGAAVLLVAAAVPAVVYDDQGLASGDEVLQLASWDQERRCALAADLSDARRAADTGRGPSVVVIGDSYAVDRGGSPKYSWPRRLPGRVHVDAFPGAGFSAAASPCGAVSYADRAPRAVEGRSASVVVVEGGLNDHAQSDRAVVAGFGRLMRVLQGYRVLVVGPPMAPDRRTEVPRVDRLLRASTAAYGATYLSTIGLRLDYRDGLHPTQRSHRVFGDAVAAAVARLLAISEPGDRAR